MEKIKEFIFGNREPAYSNRLPTQILLAIRVLVGGYILYLAKGLLDGRKDAESFRMLVIVTIAIVVFCVFGVLLIYDAARNYIIGRYVGGKLDLGEMPDDDTMTHDDIVTETEALEESVTDGDTDETP